MIHWTVLHDAGFMRYAQTVLRRQWSKRVLGRDIQTKTPFGSPFSIDVRIPFTFEILSAQWRMDWGSEVLLALLTEGQDFIDVGANIGYYSVLFAPICGRVFAFEPDAKFLPTLRRNVKGYENIEVLALALFNQEGPLTFETPAHTFNSGGLAGTRGDLTVETRTVVVRGTTLDKFLKERAIERCSIKIDTDGSEAEVLLGGLDALMRLRPIICTEFGHQVDPESSTARLLEILTKAKYCIFAFARGSRDHWTPPVLIEIPLHDFQRHWVKMFLLVPEERAAEARAFLGVNGLHLSWDQVRPRRGQAGAVHAA